MNKRRLARAAREAHALRWHAAVAFVALGYVGPFAVWIWTLKCGAFKLVPLFFGMDLSRSR